LNYNTLNIHLYYPELNLNLSIKIRSLSIIKINSAIGGRNLLLNTIKLNFKHAKHEFNQVSQPKNINNNYLFIRTDKRRQADNAQVGKQFGHLGRPAYVLLPVRVRKAQVTAHTVPHIVAVNPVGGNANGRQKLLQRKRDCGLARPAETFGGKSMAVLGVEPGFFKNRLYL